MTTSVFTVTGMTCGHCVAAVSKELQAIEGVTAVEIDLESRVVRVESADPVDRAVLAAAVDDAGYALEP